MDRFTESEKNSPELGVFAGSGEMAALMRSHDWSNTPLGPVENWPQSLKTLVSTLLASRFAQAIFWGEDYIQLYNDAIMPSYGANHPKALGLPFRETWSEVWDDQVKPMFEVIRNTGEAIFVEDLLFPIFRLGYIEETYFTFCYSPIRDETGTSRGILCTTTETTQQVISQRRLTMLRELATAGSGAKTLQSACLAAADTLNPYDIPFALFYQVNSQGNLAELVASIGLSADSAAAPPTIALTPESDTNHSTEQSGGWLLAQVLQSREPQLMTDVVDRFGALRGGSWTESPHSAFILPILSSNKEQVECLLVAGISPRLQFNSEYRSFLELVAQQVESLIANTQAYEEERKRAEALRKAEEKYRTLLDSIDEGYCVIEMHIESGEPLDYRFIETNQAFEKQSTLINAQGNWMRGLRPDYEESWFEIYRDVALTGKPIRFELSSTELEDRWFTLYAFRLGQPDERRVGILFQDITERKQAEQAKTVFLSNVSHEFRTPLTLLLGPLQDVLSDTTHSLAPPQRENLKLVQRNAIRLLKLVNTLLDFSRIEADRSQTVYEPTDLATFTAELASVFRSASKRAGLRLVVDCPPLSEPIYVDREMWEKIVLNLLSNAFKFTFEGEIEVALKMRRKQESSEFEDSTQNPKLIPQNFPTVSFTQNSKLKTQNFIELAVKDTGIGVPPAEIPHLFERFHRVKGAQGRSFEGSGIGLSLVQELVKLHGGTIQVSTVEGEGSCFRVLIPTGSTHLPGERIKATRTITSTAIGASPYVEEALQWLPEESFEFSVLSVDLQENAVHSPSSIQNSPSFNSELKTQNSKFPKTSKLKTQNAQTARILLVDDNADMREYVRRLLSERWQVETAGNGAIALNLIQKQLPDLVLADVMMPEVDGFQLLQALRADPQTKSIPIILLSARAGEEATVEGLEAGANDYLIKPFSARELMARVETQLQMSRLRHEQSANRLKDEFIATLTHELNAPLAAILTWARLLQTQPFERPMILRALEMIERNAGNQAKLIEDLLDMSSLLAGKRGLKPVPVDLVAIIDEVFNTLYPTAQAKAITATYRINDFGLDSDSIASHSIKPNEQLHNLKSKIQNPKFIISGEPKRLRQIIANVLSNAIKFTPEGGKIAIQLGLESHEPGLTDSPTYARIQIKDTGIGISADFLPFVFERFTQAEVPSRHSPGGVGIGLAIARHLVELHNGTIEIASEGEGRGATFTVRVPLISAAQIKSDPQVQE